MSTRNTLIEHCCAIECESIPAPAVAAAKLQILDCTACGLLDMGAPGVQHLIGLNEAWVGAEGCSVLGHELSDEHVRPDQYTRVGYRLAFHVLYRFIDAATDDRSSEISPAFDEDMTRLDGNEHSRVQLKLFGGQALSATQFISSEQCAAWM